MQWGEAKRFICIHGSPPPPLSSPPPGSIPPLPWVIPPPLRLPPKNTAFRLRGACRGVIFEEEGDPSKCDKEMSYLDGSWLWEAPARAYELGTDQQWPRPPFPVTRRPCPRTGWARGEGGGLMGQATTHTWSWLHCSPRIWRRSTGLLDVTRTVSVFPFLFNIVRVHSKKSNIKCKDDWLVSHSNISLVNGWCSICDCIVQLYLQFSVQVFMFVKKVGRIVSNFNYPHPSQAKVSRWLPINTNDEIILLWSKRMASCSPPVQWFYF